MRKSTILRKILLYIKCLWWNKIFLLGSISVIAGFLSHQNIIFIFSGTILLCICQFGRETVNFYLLTLEQLIHFKGDCSFPYNNESYSQKQGRKWAINIYKKKYCPFKGDPFKIL